VRRRASLGTPPVPSGTHRLCSRAERHVMSMLHTLDIYIYIYIEREREGREGVVRAPSCIAAGYSSRLGPEVGQSGLK